MRTNFEPARSFANPLDFQDQLDRWFTERANPRFHRAIRAVPAERLIEESERMRSLPSPMPQTALRSVLRVPQQPYFRFDTNDYSLDPRFAGRRVEARDRPAGDHRHRAGLRRAVCPPRRSFARHLTFTDPAHQAELDHLRCNRRRSPRSTSSFAPCLAMTR